MPGTALVGPAEALLLGLGYYLAQGPWLFGLGYFTAYRPLVAGLVAGVILGDPLAGAAIGAWLNLVYLGFVAAGGAVPGDPALAGWAGTALALAAGLDGPQAAALAVPLGLLGVPLWRRRMRWGTALARRADAAAERGDLGAVARANWLLPQPPLLLLTVVPVALGTWLLAPVAAAAGEGAPAWLLAGLGVAGGLLPALGIATGLRGRLGGAGAAWFAAGYALVAVSGGAVPVAAVGGLGAVLAAATVAWTGRGLRAAGQAATPLVLPPPRPAAGRVPRRDVVRAWLLWTFFSHGAYSDDRLQGTGFAHAMLPALRRLYPAPRDAAAAARRHLAFFNAEPNVGGAILGAAIALEERRAAGEPVDDAAIDGLKRGLMGPVSGIGDTLSQGTLTPLLLAVGAGLALEGGGPRTGDPAGALVYTALAALAIWPLGYAAVLGGWDRGRELVAAILRSGVVERLVLGAGVLGTVVLGGLAARFVHLAPGPAVGLPAAVTDPLLPALAPLLVVLGTLGLLRRGATPLRLALLALGVGLLAALPLAGGGDPCAAPLLLPPACG